MILFSYLKNFSLIVFVFVLNLFVYSMKELVCVLSHIFSSQLRQRIALKLLVLLNLNATQYWMLNISEKNMNAKINIKIQTWSPRSIEFECDWILDKAELFRTNVFQANSLYSERQRISYKWICLYLKPMHSSQKGQCHYFSLKKLCLKQTHDIQRDDLFISSYFCVYIVHRAWKWAPNKKWKVLLLPTSQQFVCCYVQ